ncbi:MAG: PQQ-binding-like beta-propeller repeat protein [Planctomycetaceae bacterium]
MRQNTILAAVVLSLFSSALHAGEWPQILGPHRNGIAENETITDSFPAGGPRVVWQREAGSGFAGPAVAGGKLVLFHRLRDEEIVEALDARNGKPLWKRAFPAEYLPSYTSDDGPRAVPLIHKGRVYVYGAQGDLRCLALGDGSVVWSRDAYEEYNSKRPFRGEPPEGYFGIGTSPIVEGDKLLLNVGGDESQAGIVAFALDDGKTVWKSTAERASYSSPVAATVDGVRHVVFCTRLNVVSLDPQTGDVRFQFPFGLTGPKVTAANPVVIGDHLFVNASYGIGAAWAKIERNDAEVIWRGEDLLASQYSTPIAHDGLLYGIHGRQDLGVAALRCVDPATQKVQWSEENFGYATLISAGGKLIILTTEGELVLAELSSREYAELDRARLFTKETRALPALSGGMLYARDAGTLRCFDLRKRE